MPSKDDFTNQIQYVPAQPGFDVLLYMPDDKVFEAHPVVAWAVLHGDENFICAQPVTVLSWSINDDRPVRMPNGEVVCDDRLWTTAEEWLAEMKTNDGTPLAIEDVTKPKIGAPVLALDSFRDKFRGGQ